jgi:hypothetical protein
LELTRLHPSATPPPLQGGEQIGNQDSQGVAVGWFPQALSAPSPCTSSTTAAIRNSTNALSNFATDFRFGTLECAARDAEAITGRAANFVRSPEVRWRVSVPSAAGSTNPATTSAVNAARSLVHQRRLLPTNRSPQPHRKSELHQRLRRHRWTASARPSPRCSLTSRAQPNWSGISTRAIVDPASS